MERWRRIPAKACGWVASIFLVAMMLMTVADVTLRATFNSPIRGVYELVELLLAYTFFIALPAVFLRDENIIVNIIDDLAPRAVPILQRGAALLAVVVLAVMAWQGWLAARNAAEFNDVTADLGLPRILHWIALLAGVTGGGVAASPWPYVEGASHERRHDRPARRRRPAVADICARADRARACRERPCRLRGARWLGAGAEDGRPRTLPARERLFAFRLFRCSS